ncbi:MAG: hypothetical protein AAFY20_22040 [Cyanobacteria bacterium J06639_14]
MVTTSSVLPIDSNILPGHNQETYQRLQSALQSTPPPQLWIAACDDLPLQRQLAATLEEGVQMDSTIASTQLVFLPDNPDLVQQIQTWAHSIAKKPPLLQILGLEQLTYRNSDQQYQFLRSLRGLLPAWQQLDFSLLIWMPRPWLKKVKRAVPSLCETVFQFIGEPTPLSAIAADQHYQAVFSPIRQWQFLQQPSSQTDVAQLQDTASPQDQVTAVDKTAEPNDNPAAIAQSETASANSAASTEANIPAYSEDLWHRLEADLTQLENTESTLLPPPVPIPTEAQQNTSNKTEVQPGKKSTASEPDTVTTEAANAAAAQASESEVLPSHPELLQAYELRDRIQAGDQSLPLLQTAIQQYERVMAQDLAAHHRTEVLNDLGSLYWLVAQQSTDINAYQESLQHSCQLYEAALNPVSLNTGKEVLTRIHSNLGSVYSLLASLQNPPQYLDKAIRAFHRALQYAPVETSPTEYTTLQTHLGTAYWSLAQHTHVADHLHRAIAAYQEALQHSHPQRMPQAYAQLQNNLGIALWSLSRYERPAFLLKHAIDAYCSALAYRTLENEPVGCAATHNNLGTAYWDLGSHCEQHSSGQKQVWQQAIAAYETALLAASKVAPGTLGFDLWATHHSVGVVYDQLAITLTPDTSTQQPLLEKAITHYVKALTGWQANGANMTDTALQAIIRNLHLQAQYTGIESQQRSLSQVPAEWLPEIWRKL